MAGHDNSEEVADIFWPGYVDAVTNLAINLLFVIAVMSIVVISVNLQIANMIPKPSSVKEERLDVRQNPDPNSRLKTSAEDLMVGQTQATEITQLKRQLGERDVTLQQLKQKLSKYEGTSISPSIKTETVTATQLAAATADANESTLGSGGLSVVFAPDAVTLQASESVDLVQKMAQLGPLSTQRWQLIMIIPKGFSEGARLAYYRVYAVRNVLLQNGVPPAWIDLRVTETERTGGSSARVWIKPVMP